MKTPYTCANFSTVTCTGIKPGRTTVTMYGVPGRLAVPWQALGAVGERERVHHHVGVDPGAGGPPGRPWERSGSGKWVGGIGTEANLV